MLVDMCMTSAIDFSCTSCVLPSPAMSLRVCTLAFVVAQVRYLKIIEKSGYQALPWVRYITQNGDYQLRVL